MASKFPLLAGLSFTLLEVDTLALLNTVRKSKMGFVICLTILLRHENGSRSTRVTRKLQLIKIGTHSLNQFEALQVRFLVPPSTRRNFTV